MPYDVDENVIKVTDSNSFKYIQEIKESIDCFNKEIDWKDMWDLEEAGKRFSKGQILFLLRDENGALGHVWFDEDYWYNLFIHPRREPGTAQRFTYHCFNFIPYKEIFAYVENWNEKAKKYVKSVGAKEISSYL